MLSIFLINLHIYRKESNCVVLFIEHTITQWLHTSIIDRITNVLTKAEKRGNRKTEKRYEMIVLDVFNEYPETKLKLKGMLQGC